MPVMHVVTLTFKPETVHAVMAELAAALDDLAAQTNAISYRHGRDLRIRDGNADYAITAVSDDDRAFGSYMANPQHQRIIEELVTPHLRTRSAIQFRVTT